MAGGHVDRTWDNSYANLSGQPCSSLDDFVMRETTASQADDRYELVSERAANGASMTLISPLSR